MMPTSAILTCQPQDRFNNPSRGSLTKIAMRMPADDADAAMMYMP